MHTRIALTVSVSGLPRLWSKLLQVAVSIARAAGRRHRGWGGWQCVRERWPDNVLQPTAALFAIENGIGGHLPDRRAGVRQDHARPLLDQLQTFLEASLARISDTFVNTTN